MDQHPDLLTVAAWVQNAISRLDPASAAGLDQLPPAFVKHAKVTTTDREGSRVRNTTQHLLAPLLTELFHTCFKEGRIPAQWKIARLSPIFKKGAVLDPNNYRMIAVSGVLYRLYANSVRECITVWAMREGKMPESQFGFVPERDTTQPSFILRHLAHNARFNQGSSRVYCAFMDFTQAYDRIPRSAMWQHLQTIGMPTTMLSAVQGMYDNDAYILVDGNRRTEAVHPTLGVKQGCPLSPLLFALYINDFESHMSAHAADGVQCRANPGRRIWNMFYADDLGLTANSAAGLQRMLTGLEEYARLKGLVVNTGKSVTMVLNTTAQPVREGSQNLAFQYQGENLAMVYEFKYLGLVLNRGMNMEQTARPRAGALIGKTREVMKTGRSLYVHDSMSAMLQLYQTFALPTGMYGCQVWASRYVRIDRMFEAEVSKLQLSFLKRQAGAPRGTANWVILAEMAKSRPIHQYWVRSLIRFRNRCLTCNSPLMVDVMKADAELRSAGCTYCWTAELVDGLKSIASMAGETEQGRVWAEAVAEGRPIDPQQVSSVLQRAYERMAWQGFENIQDIRVAQLPTADGGGRMRLTYYAWFKAAQLESPTWFRQAPGMHVQVKQFIRFRVGAHTLRVNTGRRQGMAWQDRKCIRCGDEQLQHLACAVDDEHHMIFDCTHFQNLRGGNDGLASWLQQTHGDVRAFMTGNKDMVRHFIYNCMEELDRIHEITLAQQAAS